MKRVDEFRKAAGGSGTSTRAGAFPAVATKRGVVPAHPEPEDSAGRNLAPRGGKGCQWMCFEKAWHDCGAPATRVHRPSTLCYCERHAVALAGHFHLEVLP